MSQKNSKMKEDMYDNSYWDNEDDLNQLVRKIEKLTQNIQFIYKNCNTNIYSIMKFNIVNI